MDDEFDNAPDGALVAVIAAEHSRGGQDAVSEEAVAYAILRHCGIDIGKRDFLGGIPIRMTWGGERAAMLEFCTDPARNCRPSAPQSAEGVCGRGKTTARMTA